MSEVERPVVWVGSSRRDLREFPREVRRDIGRALYAAQDGEIDPAAKPMRGFCGGSIVEIIAHHRGDTWRNCLYRSFCGSDLRTARVPEEVETWDRHRETGYRTDSAAFGGS